MIIFMLKFGLSKALLVMTPVKIKSSIVLSGILFLISLTVAAGKVEQVYHFGNPSIQQIGEYQKVNLDNTMLTAIPGQPVLPYRQVKLLLPPGESAVSFEIVFSDEVTLPGTFNLFPQQEARPISEGISGVFMKDMAVYTSNSAYPTDPRGQIITSFLNGRSFALATFTPFRYNPVTGMISYFATAQVVVHTAPDAIAVKALSNLVSGSNEVLKLADNKNMDVTYLKKRLSAPIQYDLLIICTTEFRDSFANYQTAYLREGITSLTVSLDSITASMPGVDVPEKIRNFIIQEYQTHEIQYVLLAGDNELIPHRGLYCYVQSGAGYTDSNIPADLYYSALDGTWNNDGDALWGEAEDGKPDEADLLPDVAVGRMPFSDAAELDHMLNKSYKYQFTPVPGEFRNILMAGENLWTVEPFVTWGSDYLELLKGEHSDNGYTTTGIPTDYLFDNMYDEISNWTGQDLMNHINQGRPMLHHVGHSSKTYVMKLGNIDITNDNFSSLNGIDHNFTIVYTHGCDCGAFDYNDCIAEKMVTISNFAVAFIGNSRYGWFNEGQTEGPSPHLHREFIDALYSDSLNRIGRAHMESKIASAAWVTAPGQWEPGALRWCFYDCNVLGDPALAVFTDNPFDINTTFPSSVPFGTTSINVSVTSAGLPASGLTCVVTKEGILIGKSITDSSGQAVINFDIISENPGISQLTVSGYNCVPVTYEFEVIDYTGKSELATGQVNMTISPNPAHEMITVNALLEAHSDFVLKVFNAEGKAIITNKKDTAGANGRIIKNLDISSLKKGYYTCEIKSKKKNISKPFIIY
jgi:hypothetical protein